MVLEAAQGSNVQLYVSTFYQEGGSPKFDDGIKAWPVSYTHLDVYKRQELRWMPEYTHFSTLDTRYDED